VGRFDGYAKRRNAVMEKLGILVLGQTPRPDIERLFGAYLPGVELIVQGALDGLAAGAVDELAGQTGDYPLLVILAAGTTREIAMDRLAPRLSAAARHAESRGASAAILFCAGDFPDLDCRLPVIYPGRIVPALVGGLSRTRRVGVITPNPGQVEPARRHWEAKGFRVSVAVASPKDPGAIDAAAARMQDPSLELVVLDCMGFAPSAARRMKALARRPVICAQSLVARAAAELIGAYPLD
jgi:protein AroM